MDVNVVVALLHRLFHNRNSGLAHTTWGSVQAFRQVTALRRRGYSSRHSGQLEVDGPSAVFLGLVSKENGYQFSWILFCF